jgi:PadR family transcriptional regulator, regulatory protein PadR
MGLFVDSKAALLQVLTEGEGYGLELIERVRERTNGEIELLQGRVYPALRELEEDGLVKSYESEPIPERGGRPRRYYKLTAEGRRAARGQAKIAQALFQPAVRAGL